MEQCFTIARHYSRLPDQELLRRLTEAAAFVGKVVIAPVERHHRVALTSLTADVLTGHCGGGQYELADLVNRINQGWRQVAGAMFVEFCFYDGRLSRAARLKRQTEAKLFVCGVLKLY